MRAKKSLGQNFLIDVNIQGRIVAALEAKADDAVIEIGPGHGALTRHLVGAVDRLTMVELDNRIVAALEAEYAEREDVTVLHADVLDVPLGTLFGPDRPFKVIGNIPYNITTPIIFHALKRPRPERLVLMVQQEVADRILAPPGSAEYGALSVGVRTVARCRRVLNVPRSAFRPRPRVDSTVVCMDPLSPSPLTEPEEKRLRRLVRASFQWRRKQLQKILRDHPDLGLPKEALPQVAATTELDLTLRPEVLSPDQFVSLSHHLSELAGFV